MTQEELKVLQDMFTASEQRTEQRMQGMIQENNKTLAQMMDEKLVAQDKRTEEKFEAVYEQLAEIREDTAITRTATNTLVEWADDVSVITQIKYPVKKAK